MTAEAAVTGITEEQLAALQRGGWGDNDAILPGWKREVKVGNGDWENQWIFPSVFTGWNAVSTNGEDDIWQVGFDEALAWCDNLAGGRKPAEAGSVTKQEDRFALLPADGQLNGETG